MKHYLKALFRIFVQSLQFFYKYKVLVYFSLSPLIFNTKNVLNLILHNVPKMYTLLRFCSKEIPRFYITPSQFLEVWIWLLRYVSERHLL